MRKIKVISMLTTLFILTNSSVIFAKGGDYYDSRTQTIYTIDDMKDVTNRRDIGRSLVLNQKVVLEYVTGKFVDGTKLSKDVAAKKITAKEALVNSGYKVTQADFNNFVDYERVFDVESVE